MDNWWNQASDFPLFSIPPPPVRPMRSIYVVHEPSSDDCGDFYVVVHGVQQRPGYWSYGAAARAMDDYLWRGMVIG